MDGFVGLAKRELCLKTTTVLVNGAANQPDQQNAHILGYKFGSRIMPCYFAPLGRAAIRIARFSCDSAQLEKAKGPGFGYGDHAGTSRMRAILLRLASTDFSARRSIAVLLLILLLAGLCSGLLAFIKPLWYDEICTVILSRLPSASAIWGALENVADNHPPLFYYAARLTRQLVPDDHLGYRLPSILGLLGTVLCIYIILSKNVDRLSALVGAAFILCTPLAAYGYEARPYALMLTCVAGAILAWKHIDDSRWVCPVALAITLAAAVSLHYYAIFVWPAFVLAEASVCIFRRRFRVGAWAALLIGGLPMLLFVHILLKLARYYGQHFWGPAHIGQIFEAQSWLFNLGGYWGSTLTFLVTVTLLYWSLRERPPLGWSGQRKLREQALSIEECALTIMLLWLPVVAVAAAKISSGLMTYRYMQPTVLGGALAVGYLTSKAPPAARMLLLSVMLTNYGLNSLFEVNRFLNGSPFKRSLLAARAAAAGEFEAILAQHPDRDHPIVISSLFQYLPMAYYTPADRSRQMYALVDPQSAFAKADGTDLGLMVLRRYFPLQVQDYRDFASRNLEFLLVSRGTSDWWPARLSHDGHTLRLLSEARNTRIYKVTLSPDRQREGGNLVGGKEPSHMR